MVIVTMGDLSRQSNFMEVFDKSGMLGGEHSDDLFVH
jgi:hypothetical protein